MPVWKYATSSITRNRDGETGTVKVKILGSDIYYLKDTLTTDNIFVYVANSETPDAPVTTITKSLEKITDTADLEGADTGYYLTLGNFGTHDGQVKITIADKYARATQEMQDADEDYLNLLQERPYLKITEWSVNDITCEAQELGLSGSPTKVKNIESVVFQAKEAKVLEPSDTAIDEMMKELIVNHTVG